MWDSPPIGPIAQWIEQQPSKLWVAGSSPAWVTRLIIEVILKTIRKWKQIKLKSAQDVVRNFPLKCLEREVVKTVSVLGVKAV